VLAVDTNIIVRYLTADHPEQLEDPALAAKALEWMRSGLDFADALHLAKAEGCEAFVSFDTRFAAVANALSEIKVRAP